MPPAHIHRDSCLGPVVIKTYYQLGKTSCQAGWGVRGGVACREREGGYCLTDVVISKSGLENEEEN